MKKEQDPILRLSLTSDGNLVFVYRGGWTPRYIPVCDELDDPEWEYQEESVLSVDFIKVHTGQTRSPIFTQYMFEALTHVAVRESPHPNPELFCDFYAVVNCVFCQAVENSIKQTPSPEKALEKAARALMSTLVSRDNPHKLRGRSPKDRITKLWDACTREAHSIQKAASDNRALLPRSETGPGYEGLSLTSKTDRQIVKNPPGAYAEAFSKLSIEEQLRKATKIKAELSQYAFFNVYRGFNLFTVLAVSSVLKRASEAGYLYCNGKGPAPDPKSTGLLQEENGESRLDVAPEVLLQIMHPENFKNRDEKLRWKKAIFTSLLYISLHPALYQDRNDPQHIRTRLLFELSFDPLNPLAERIKGYKDDTWTLYRISESYTAPYKIGESKSYDDFLLKPFQNAVALNTRADTKNTILDALGIITAYVQRAINRQCALARDKCPRPTKKEQRTMELEVKIPPCTIPLKVLSLPHDPERRDEALIALKTVLEAQGYTFTTDITARVASSVTIDGIPGLSITY